LKKCNDYVHQKKKYITKLREMRKILLIFSILIIIAFYKVNADCMSSCNDCTACKKSIPLAPVCKNTCNDCNICREQFGGGGQQQQQQQQMQQQQASRARQQQQLQASRARQQQLQQRMGASRASG
jgi:hypothetical protein